MKPTGYERHNAAELVGLEAEFAAIQSEAHRQLMLVRREIKRRQKQEQKGETT